MIIQERIRKEGNALALRLNELGLKVRDHEFVMFDWNPMFVDILYDEPEEGFGVMKKKPGEKEK